MKRRQTVGEKLSSTSALFGFMQMHPSTAISELAGICGYDFIILDCEHGLFGEMDIVHSLQAIAATGMSAFVRLRGHDCQALGRYLDMGADGIIVPNVATADQAELLARAMEHPPRGTRGFAGPGHRTTRYGFDAAEHIASPRAGAFLAVLIESARGVQKAGEILAVDGVDAALIGPSDLTADLGKLGDLAQPGYAKAWSSLEQAAADQGKICGGVLHAGQSVSNLVARGNRFFIIGSDIALIREAMVAQLAAARGC